MAPPRHLLLHLALALALAAGTAAGPACGRPQVYQPDTTLVSRLGREQALARLHAVLARAESPPVLDVDITPEYLAIQWMDSRRVSRLRFRRIESIDIGSRDHVVTIRLTSTRHIYRIDFTNSDDAAAFVDLLASFYRATQPGELPAVTRDRERL